MQYEWTLYVFDNVKIHFEVTCPCCPKGEQIWAAVGTLQCYHVNAFKEGLATSSIANDYWTLPDFRYLQVCFLPLWWSSGCSMYFPVYLERTCPQNMASFSAINSQKRPIIALNAMSQSLLCDNQPLRNRYGTKQPCLEFPLWQQPAFLIFVVST